MNESRDSCIVFDRRTLRAIEATDPGSLEGATIYTENPALLESLRARGLEVAAIEMPSLEVRTELEDSVGPLSMAWMAFLNRYYRDSHSCPIQMGDALGSYAFWLLSVLVRHASLLELMLERKLSVTIPYDRDQDTFGEDGVVFTSIMPLRINYFGVVGQLPHYASRLRLLPLSTGGSVPTRFYGLPSTRMIHWKYFLLGFAVDPTFIPRTILRRLLPTTNSSAIHRLFLRRKVSGILYIENDLLDRSLIDCIKSGLGLVRFKEPQLTVSSDKLQRGRDLDLLRTGMINIASSPQHASTRLMRVHADSVAMAANRIALYLVDYLHPLQEAAFEHVAKWKAGQGSRQFVLLSNNSLNKPVRSLFRQSFAAHSVPLVCFQHGCLGTYVAQRWAARFLDMNYCAGFVSFNANEGRYLFKHTGNTGGEIFVRGVSHARRARFPWMARTFARILARRSMQKRLIVYAPCVFAENMTRLCHNGDDMMYWRFMKEFVLDVLGEAGISTIIKTHKKGLLPSEEFRAHPLNTVDLPPHIEVRSDPDFRYMRFAADMLIIDRASGTLEVALSCDVPLVFMDLEEIPLEAEVREGLRRSIFLVEVKRGRDWKREVLDILRMPRSAISRIWKEKSRERERFCQDFSTGPDGSDRDMALWLRGMGARQSAGATPPVPD